MCKYFILAQKKKDRKRRGVKTQVFYDCTKKNYSVNVTKSVVFVQCQVLKITAIVARLLISRRVNKA